jgi:hypothetical protein
MQSTQRYLSHQAEIGHEQPLDDGRFAVLYSGEIIIKAASSHPSSCVRHYPRTGSMRATCMQ